MVLRNLFFWTIVLREIFYKLQATVTLPVNKCLIFKNMDIAIIINTIVYYEVIKPLYIAYFKN